MTNNEIPMTKENRNPNDQGKTSERAGTSWTFVLGHSLGIRPSDFLVLQSLLTSAAAKL